MLKMLLGSNAELIFRNSSIPVLTVGPKVPIEAPAEGDRRVLFATGFAAQSLYAGRFALAIAQHNRAQLAMLHVVQEDAEEPGQHDRLQRESAERLRQLIPANVQLAVAPEIRVAFGPPAEAILNTATEWKPDLIVLGLRRHSESTTRAVWVTAYQVVSNAPCPVLTVRTPEEWKS
jgi:nucleotide-binding universal stress UspA family protein